MTMYCIAGLNMIHMLLHVESDCDVHDITGGRMWRIICTVYRVQSTEYTTAYFLNCMLLLYYGTVEDKFIHLEIGELWCPDTNQNGKIWI